MLGLFLLYFIWKRYSDLALEHDKHKWGYGILGIVIYYAGTFIGGIVIGVIDFLAGSDIINSSANIVLSLIALPFGLLSVWGLYKFLQNRWSKESKSSDNNSLDSDLI